MRTRALGQIILGVVLLAVLAFVLANRDRGDGLDSNTTITTTGTTGTPSTTVPLTETTTTTPQTDATGESTTTTATPTGTQATTTTTAATTTTTAAVATTIAATASPEYAAGLADARRTVSGLVDDMAETNQAFDDRYSTGPDFRMTADAFSAVITGAQGLAEQVAGLTVPPALADLHVATGGPFVRATRLAPLAEEVLEGLRLPYPEDGSARRSAVAAYNAASEEFDTSVNQLVSHVRDNAENLGVGSTEPGDEGLSEEASVYLEQLTGLAGTAAGLLDDLNGANQAWEDQRAAQATYRQVEVALLDIVEGSRSLESAVRSLPAPDDLAGLHGGQGGPVELAGRLVELAEEVVAGLRLPSPDDGSTRRDAATRYALVAGQFDAIAEQLISRTS